MIADNISIEEISAKNLRHVDVAILYGLGQKDRAHEIALKLKPREDFHWMENNWTEKEVEEFMRDFEYEDDDEKNKMRSVKATDWLPSFID